MTPPYLFISFTALLLTPGTRKRPPQSGSVQTGFGEVWIALLVAKALAVFSD